MFGRRRRVYFILYCANAFGSDKVPEMARAMVGYGAIKTCN
jgi:hypothetical protein